MWPLDSETLLQKKKMLARKKVGVPQLEVILEDLERKRPCCPLGKPFDGEI